MQTCPHHYCLSILEGIDFRVHLAGCVLTLPKRCKLACNVGEQQYQKNSKETKEPNPKPQATPTIWFYSYVRLFGNDSSLPTIIPTTIPTNGTVECNRKLPLNEGSVASPRTLLPFCRSLADASGKAIAACLPFLGSCVKGCLIKTTTLNMEFSHHNLLGVFTKTGVWQNYTVSIVRINATKLPHVLLWQHSSHLPRARTPGVSLRCTSSFLFGNQIRTTSNKNI